MYKFYQFLLITAILFCSQANYSQEFNYTDSWGNNGFTLTQEKPNSLTINFSISGFSMNEIAIDGETLKTVNVAGIFLPNDEGAPDLPGTGRFIAIPQGAIAAINIVAVRTEKMSGVNIAPAPRIPLDTDKGPLHYEKNLKIFNSNSFYPAENIKLGQTTQIRGVDVVMIGITPFQYNPVTKELIIYRDIEVEVSFSGGNGHVGDDRLRSRWWDPILTDAVLNPNAIPIMDYSKKPSIKDTPDYEYIIISPDDAVFISWANQIKDWRQLQGIKTGIVTTTEVGGNTTSAIENYINNAYNTWDVPPAAVLLLGDYGTSGSTVVSPIYNSYCVSDNIYADIDGNQLPDVVFARMTAQNATHLETMITKFLTYEQSPPTDPDFYDHPITALGWQTERWFQICSEVVGGFWKNVQGKNPVRINAIYIGTPGTSWSTATNTSTVVNYFGPAPTGLGYIPTSPATLGGWSGGTAAMVNTALNSGAFALQHRDHGGETGWGEPAYYSSNIDGLTNVGKLSWIFSINCLTGKYNYASEVFAEKFHRYKYNGQNAGALGITAASEVSYSFVNDTYVWGMMDNLWPNFMPAYGTTPPSRDVLPAFGNAAGKIFLAASSWPYNTDNKEVTYHLFHHHGDAFTTVYSEVPQNLTVSHNAALLGGVNSFTVTANTGSFIALTVNGDIIGTANGTGSPVVISIAPQIPGNTMIVTVTKQNYYRYSSAVDIIPPSGPYVAYENHSINDASGNNNGLADFGESIALNMTLKNLGSVTANNVTTTLICTDTYLTLTDNTQLFGTIASGTTSTVNNAFAFDVADNIPDQHVFNFELQISGTSDDVWTSNFSITSNAPLLEPASSLVIDDLATGNGNGRLDPGETANITATVLNNGHSLSPSATATLTSASLFITINSGSDALGQVAASGSANADFNITCSPATPVGQSVDLAMDVAAGNYGFSHTYYTSVGLVLEDWETGDFTRFPWTLGGNANWTIASTGQYEGLYTGRSGVISHSQTSEMSVMLQVTTGGNISFYRKTSSESGYDYLRFYVDGVQQAQWSGETAWGQVSYAVTAGIHTFKWTYYKDGSVVSGSDCVWVDYIVFPASVVVAPEINISPMSFSMNVAPDEISTAPLTISNLGNLDLTWNAFTQISGKDGGEAYCTASGTCDEYISSVVFNTINNSSSCSQYADYTAISTTVTAGLAYNITVTNGVIYTTDDLGVWIDWNQDQDFTDAGENVVCVYSNSGQGTYSITIPEDALSGPTRMRIRLKYSGDDCGSSCGATTYGEVEDYTVIVEGTDKWLTIAPASGTITQGNNQNPTVTFDATGLIDGTYTGNITVNSNDADEGQVVIPCTMIVASGFDLNLKAMLEGPFGTTEMSAILNTNGILPLSQPFNTAPWNYNGTESVAAIPNVNVVDWVLVELRDAASAVNATAATRIARQAAFILKNGSIVGMDGTSKLQFTNSVTQQLFAVVYHRNHLGIMSATGLTQTSGTYNYNFTTASGQAYGTNSQKQLASGIWGIIGGDADANGTIGTTDMTAEWNTEAGEAGLYSCDLNLDGQVNNIDKDDCWQSNLGASCQVPE